MEEVDDPGQLAAGTVRVSRRGMLADENPAAGMAGHESFFSKQADRLLDGHTSNTEELGQFVAGRELVSALQFTSQDRGPNRVGNFDERGTRVRWVHWKHVVIIYRLPSQVGKANWPLRCGLGWCRMLPR